MNVRTLQQHRRSAWCRPRFAAPAVAATGDRTKAVAVPLFATALAALPAPSSAQPILPAGTYLNTFNNGQITAPSGRYRLNREFAFRLGGNWQLVMRRQDGSVRWSPKALADHVYMQNDGNFVLYSYAEPRST